MNIDKSTKLVGDSKSKNNLDKDEQVLELTQNLFEIGTMRTTTAT
jgi:hypothetical protein